MKEKTVQKYVELSYIDYVQTFSLGKGEDQAEQAPQALIPRFIKKSICSADHLFFKEGKD